MEEKLITQKEPFTHQIGVRLTDSDIKRIKKLVVKYNRTISYIARLCILDGLDKIESQNG